MFYTFTNADKLDMFQCCSCLKYRKPPIYTCVAKHAICKKCASKLPVVCTRTQKCTYRKVRNLQLERATDDVFLTCRNKKRGCLAKLKYYEKLPHEESCGKIIPTFKSILRWLRRPYPPMGPTFDD